MASLSSSSSSSSISLITKNMQEKKLGMVSLKTYEGEIFQVDERIAVQSETIKNMMNELGNGDTEFPLPNVRSKTLKRVIEYCQKHVAHATDDDASSLSSEDKDEAAAAAAAAEELSAWDLEFVKSFNTNVLYHLLLASNYLEVNGLMDLIIQRAANLIKGKTPEQIRETFGIKNDFPPGVEEEIRKENPWAFEIPSVDHRDAAEEIHQPSSDDQVNKVLQEKLEKLEID